MISTETPLIMSIIVGIIKVIHLLTNRFVFVSLWFASSKRSSSCFSRLNARITGIPVRISRVTRFSLSTRVCSIVNLGIATWNRTTITTRIRTTARPRIHVIEESVFNTRITPPIPRIGAYSTIRKNIAITCCTC